MALGNKLKDLLYKKGLTVKEFAKQIGVPSTTLYSFIQRDSQDAKIDLVMKICTGLGITLNEFVGDSEVIDGEEGIVFDLTDFDTEEQISLVLKKLLDEKHIKIQNSKTGETKEFSITSSSEPITTIAAHFDGDEYTEDELHEIRKFAEFLKSKRKDEE